MSELTDPPPDFNPFTAIPTEPLPGEPGHPDTPMPAPSLGFTMGLTEDPYDYSHDGDIAVQDALGKVANEP
jgi:hypothetical protein